MDTEKNKRKEGGKGMKKLLMFLVTLLLMVGFVSITLADDAKPMVFADINLQGDTLYLPDSGSFAAGIGIDIAKFYDIVSLRAEAITSFKQDTSDRIGIGLGVNIPKLISMSGGTWLLKGITSSVGVLGVFNINNPEHFEPAVYVTILKIEF